MVTSQREFYISPEKYLESEKVSQVRHEYIDGQVYAMAGVSDAQFDMPAQHQLNDQIDVD